MKVGFVQVSFVTSQVDEPEMIFELWISIKNLTVRSSSNLRIVLLNFLLAPNLKHCNMNQEHKADIAIVGGGIVGLAHAYMALLKGTNEETTK